MIFNTIVLSALAATVFAEPISRPRVLHEKRDAPLDTRGERIAPNAIIPIRIGLRQSNLEHGYDEVMDVSDPRSERYGDHWTIEQVHEYFAPAEESIEAVKNWLIEFGIDHEVIGHSDDKQWIGVNLPLAQAEELLGAEYYEHNAGDGYARIGCDEYYLPMHISKHVDYIKPGITLSPPLEKKTFTRRSIDELSNELAKRDLQPINPGGTGQNGPGKLPVPSAPQALAPGASTLAADLKYCGYQITPACIRALYNIPRNTINNAQNALGIVEFSPQEYSQQDLNMFYKAFAPYVPQGTHPKLVSIDGGKAPAPQKQADLEPDVDFDIAISLVYPQTTVLYQVGQVSYKTFTEKEELDEVTFLVPLLDALDGSFCTSADRKAGFQCGGAPLTRVISVSYGTAELFLGQAAVIRSCNEVMKLSLRGSTIIFASGDYGVANSPSKGYNGCINPKNPNISGKVFSPDFPADCPYVLGVGATQLYADETVKDPEYVLYQPSLDEYGATFSSGGGFSNYFSAPSYQKSAVQHYLTNYAPNYPSYVYNGYDLYSGKSNIGANGGVYNRIGRGIPDVSANGANFTLYVEGDLFLSYGTSLAAPIWASVVTLINEQRSKAGASPVGFINPILYQNPQAFHDITRGTNPGCGTNGFPASPGWDPSTGLGTPDFPALLQIFEKAAHRK